MTGHTIGICACRECEPVVYEDGDRMHEGHLAVRFGDYGISPRVTCDGALVDRVTEVIAGAQGAAWFATQDEDGRAHRCRRCGVGFCEHVVFGEVKVQVVLSDKKESAV